MGDDEFDWDDDLDTLPANTLQQLEESALRSTQISSQRRAAVNRPFKPPTRRTPLKPPPLRPPLHNGVAAAAKQEAEASPSDYGFGDEDVIDLDEPAHPQYTKPLVQTQWGQPTSMDQFRQSQSQRGYSTYQLANRAPPTGSYTRAINQPRPGVVGTSLVSSQRYQPTNALPRRPGSTDVNKTFFPPSQRRQSPPPSQNYSSSTQQDTEHVDSHLTETLPPIYSNTKEEDVPDINFSELQARIAELEAQNRDLQTSLSEAHSTAQAKAGEAAILRSKQQKEKTEFEKRLLDIQEKNAELLAKQKFELEAARKDREKVETNNKFLEHDLALEAERARQARRTLRDATGNKGKGALQSPAGTPRRKEKTRGIGDGFDDDDMIMLSPSKLLERGKKGGGSTPKQGTKRKRMGEKGQSSPGLALQLENRESPREPEIIAIEKPVVDFGLLAKIEEQSGKFKFLQKLLNYRPRGSRERVLEAFTKYEFPSAPTITMSSMIYDHLSKLSVNDEDQPLAKSVCILLCQLWERSLEEQYNAPLFLIIDTIQYILDSSPFQLSTDLCISVLPPAMATIDLIAIPIAEAAIAAAKHPAPHQTNNSISTSGRKLHKVTPAKSVLDPKIPIDTALSLIYSVALAAAITREEDASKTFWKSIKYDFLLVMLNKGQQLKHLVQTLCMLRTSSLADSFGAIIVPTHESLETLRQTKVEAGMVDRLSCLLFEVPIPPEGSNRYSLDEVSQLRVEVLSCFMSMCASAHGTNLLADHPSFIGRLVKFLSTSIGTLYSRPLPLSALPAPIKLEDKNTLFGEPTPTPRHPIPAINLTMRIIAHILFIVPPVDIRSRLQATPGGPHKYLVSLTRLAFADTTYLVENGIEEEVIGAAHRLLEEWVSPEEGEQLVLAFSSAATTRDARMEDTG